MAEGQFTLRFTVDSPHIVCVIAPCPTGTYTVEVGGRDIVHSRFLEVAHGTPDAERLIIETLPQEDVSKSIVVDGEAWFSHVREAIVVRVRHVAEERRQ